MSLVINSNDQREPLFNNDFLSYYRNFSNYLFLPDRSITAAAGSTPETNASAFNINGTVVNSLCQKVFATSTTSISETLTLNCPQQVVSTSNVPLSNLFSGKIRLGDFYSFYGGESFSSVEFLGTCVFNVLNGRYIRQADCSIFIKIGFLHEDGTITYFIDQEINKKGPSTNARQSLNMGSGEMFYFACQENEALEGDKLIIELQGKINSGSAVGQSGTTAWDSCFTFTFGTDQPFIQLNF